MKETDIPVATRQQIATYRQIIRVQNQETVSDLMIVLCQVFRARRFTGSITVDLVSGGVRSIVTEETAKVPQTAQATEDFGKHFVK